LELGSDGKSFETERRKKMEKTFSSIMSEFMKGLSENDKKRMMACGEKMASMCSCPKMKEMSEEEKKAMVEKMMSFCGSKMEMMSSFLKQMGSGREQTGGPENQ
jgi:excinuclease UvrABC nuclease subunit